MPRDDDAHVGLIRHDEKLRMLETRMTDMESHINSLLVERQKLSTEFEYDKQANIRLRKKQTDTDVALSKIKQLITQIKYLIIGAVFTVAVIKSGLSNVITKIVGF